MSDEANDIDNPSPPGSGTAFPTEYTIKLHGANTIPELVVDTLHRRLPENVKKHTDNCRFSVYESSIVLNGEELRTYFPGGDGSPAEEPLACFTEYAKQEYGFKQGVIHVYLLDPHQGWEDGIPPGASHPAGAVTGGGSDHIPCFYLNAINYGLGTANHELGHMFQHAGSTDGKSYGDSHNLFNYSEEFPHETNSMGNGYMHKARKYDYSGAKPSINTKEWGPDFGTCVDHLILHDEVYTDAPDYFYNPRIVSFGEPKEVRHTPDSE